MLWPGSPHQEAAPAATATHFSRELFICHEVLSSLCLLQGPWPTHLMVRQPSGLQPWLHHQPASPPEQASCQWNLLFSLGSLFLPPEPPPYQPLPGDASGFPRSSLLSLDALPPYLGTALSLNSPFLHEALPDCCQGPTPCGLDPTPSCAPKTPPSSVFPSHQHPLSDLHTDSAQAMLKSTDSSVC